jgi:hypothetical protein
MAETLTKEITVAYLTMAWNRSNTMNAVKNAEQQNYPDHLKTLHLLYQHPFPNPLQHSKLFNIVESQSPGKWADVWAFKVESFLKVVTADVVVWFDEDDRFEPDYTLKGLLALTDGGGDIAWNIMTEFVTRDSIDMREFLVGSGTLVIRTEVLKELWDKFRKQHPSNSIRIAPDKYYPIDGPFFFVWRDDPRCVFHEGIRSYFLHSNSAGSHSWDVAELLDTPSNVPYTGSGFHFKNQDRLLRTGALNKSANIQNRRNPNRGKG